MAKGYVVIMTCTISPEKVSDDTLRRMIEDHVNDQQSGTVFDNWSDLIESNKPPNSLEAAAIIALSKENKWSLYRAYREVMEVGVQIHRKVSAGVIFKHDAHEYVVMTRRGPL